MARRSARLQKMVGEEEEKSQDHIRGKVGPRRHSARRSVAVEKIGTDEENSPIRIWGKPRPRNKLARRLSPVEEMDTYVEEKSPLVVRRKPSPPRQATRSLILDEKMASDEEKSPKRKGGQLFFLRESNGLCRFSHNWASNSRMSVY